MPTILRVLSEEERVAMHENWRPVYFDGECYAFAVALHRGLGWQIIGLMNGEEIRHACVRSPEGKLHDVRGFITEEEFGNPFLAPPYELREIEESDLCAVRPVQDGSIKYARIMAENVWPELPWQETLAKRAQVFADAIEAVCREHGFWIRSPYPAALPLLAKGDGDEGGYELQLTADGLTYTIDRYFA